MEDKKIDIIFQYHKYSIDSFISFDDGDFILMITGSPKDHPVLYDGKTLKPKLNLTMSYESLFILGSHQIGIFSKLKFQLYNLNKDRTEIKFDQTVVPKGTATGLKLKKLSNDDLLVYSFYLGSYDIAIYRKDCNNMYEIQNQFLTENLDEIFEINKDEVLGYKLTNSPECLTFKILSKDNYSLKRKNMIPFVLKWDKRRIYLTQPIFQLSDDKLISFGTKSIYIFDIKTLELETTIKMFRTILRVLKRPKGNIFLFTSDFVRISPYADDRREEYYMDNIRFNLKSNEIFEDEKNITDELGAHKTIFDFYNYKDNGFVTITDNNNIIIYGNYYD